jgi:hypothetical protein
VGCSGVHKTQHTSLSSPEAHLRKKKFPATLNTRKRERRRNSFSQISCAVLETKSLSLSTALDPTDSSDIILIFGFESGMKV